MIKNRWPDRYDREDTPLQDDIETETANRKIAKRYALAKLRNKQMTERQFPPRKLPNSNIDIARLKRKLASKPIDSDAKPTRKGGPLLQDFVWREYGIDEG